MRRLRRLGFSSYAEYLGSELWETNRQRWFLEHQDTLTCYLCASQSNIQLHHRNYSRVGAERTDDLVPLCSGCHLKVHRFVDAGECNLEHAHEYLRKLDDAGIVRNTPTRIIRATQRGRRRRRQ
jgi:hypothetical protein